MGGLATPGGGWGVGPGLAPPSTGAGEDTTFPPAYPGLNGPKSELISPAAGAEHKPAKLKKTKGKTGFTPQPAAGGSRKWLWVVVAFLGLLVLTLGTLVVLRLVFKVF